MNDKKCILIKHADFLNFTANPVPENSYIKKLQYSFFKQTLTIHHGAQEKFLN
jgi:hypothetical protein